MSDNVAAQGEHDRMCPVCVPMPENQCGYCHLIARVREDERANLYTMGQLADRFEESYAEGRKEGYARGLIEGDHGGRREGYRSGYAAGKDAVMTDSYAQAVAEGQRDERERLQQEYEDHAAAIAAAYTLMGAAIQNGIDAERKRIRFAIAALVDGDVIDLSLPEYRAVLEAIDEEEES